MLQRLMLVMVWWGCIGCVTATAPRSDDASAQRGDIVDETRDASADAAQRADVAAQDRAAADASTATDVLALDVATDIAADVAQDVPIDTIVVTDAPVVTDAAPSALRQRAPTSAVAVLTPRPWLYWFMPAGVEGARVELCATRACDRVVDRWDVTGDRMRVPYDLARGVYFWRLYARRGGRLDDAPSAPWELVVSNTPEALFDVNGDGRAERWSLRSGTPSMLDLWDEGATAPTQSVAVLNWPLYSVEGSPMGGTYSSEMHVSPTAVGDLNGDGYGDLVVLMQLTSTYFRITPRSYRRSLEVRVYTGGPAGLATTPLLTESTMLEYLDSGYSPYMLANGVASFLGDTSGDGFGDALVLLPPTVESGGFYVSNGVLGGITPTRGGANLYGRGADMVDGYYARGDFDADGVTDQCTAVDAPRPGETILRSVRCASSATAPLRYLTSCAGVPLTVAYRTSARDFDGDGYDDLRIDAATFAGSAATSALYRGGPTGLSEARCELLAPGA